nr:hypothetical protein [Tanacetum cinerariifolium]
MQILNEPSFFLTNKTGAPQGEESSCSCSNNSFISDGAKRYGSRATGAAPRIRLIWNSTSQAGGRPGKSSGNTSGKSWTIEHEITINRDSLLMELNAVDTKLLSAPVSNNIDA